MARLVLKFGGTSVADIERIKKVALRVKSEVDKGIKAAENLTIVVNNSADRVKQNQKVAKQAGKKYCGKRQRMSMPGYRVMLWTTRRILASRKPK